MSDIKTPKPRPPIRWGHIETELAPVAPAEPIAMSEISRNLLAVVGNKHNDPIAVERAKKQLENFRGDPAVDNYFARVKYLREQEILKQKIKTLAQRPIK
jgi:hypothetical protein